MLTIKSQKSPEKYICENCDYNTCNYKDFKKHLLTLKHSKTDKMLTKDDTESPKKYKCDCGKKYSQRQSLFVHKKKCTFKHKDLKDEQIEKLTGLVTELVQTLKEQNTGLMEQNSELIGTFKELVPKIGNSNTTINNDNRVSLNVFLNENCKNAITIEDFHNNIKKNACMPDLIYLKDKGLVEGITSVLRKNLESLDICERPIHCTDKKREIFYIKDKEGKWQKDVEKKMLESAIEWAEAWTQYQLGHWQNEVYLVNQTLNNKEIYEDFCKIFFIEWAHHRDQITKKVVKEIGELTYLDKKEL